jgi:hypothetical protein
MPEHFGVKRLPMRILSTIQMSVGLSPVKMTHFQKKFWMTIA